MPPGSSSCSHSASPLPLTALQNVFLPTEVSNRLIVCKAPGGLCTGGGDDFVIATDTVSPTGNTLPLCSQTRHPLVLLLLLDGRAKANLPRTEAVPDAALPLPAVSQQPGCKALHQWVSFSHSVVVGESSKTSLGIGRCLLSCGVAVNNSRSP